MKRFVPALSLLLLPVLPAHADFILGAQVSKSWLDVTQTAPGFSASDRLDSKAGLGFIFGVGQPGGGSRISAEWSAFEIGGEVDLDLLNFSYSYFFPALPASGSLKLRPFAGGELGYGWLDVDAQPLYNGGDDSGLLYGVRAGLNLAVSDRAEVELGVRYGRVNLEAELAGKTPAAGRATYEVENNTAWWLGFNIGL
jgi:hypothetical protein